MEMVFVLAAKLLLFDICMNIFVHTVQHQSLSMLVLEVWLCINQTVDHHKNVKREYTNLHCFQEKSCFSFSSMQTVNVRSSISSFLLVLSLDANGYTTPWITRKTAVHTAFRSILLVCLWLWIQKWCCMSLSVLFIFFRNLLFFVL